MITMPLLYATTFPVPQELPGEFDSTAADRDSIEARIRVLRTYVLNATTADLHCDVFDAAWEMADLHETLEGMS